MSAVDQSVHVDPRWGPEAASLVRRPLLVDRLVVSTDTPVVMIMAPAGYGKSTLLRMWEEAEERPFALLNLSDSHNDPVLLTASIAQAVAEHVPVDDDPHAALPSGSDNAAVVRLLEFLRRSAAHAVLALDDMHVLTAPESIDVVSALADGLPDRWQLALASRCKVGIRLNRLRANRAMTELTATDLAMTPDEAAILFEGCGLHLHRNTVARLVERTEGWPAALYLAALSMHGAPDAEQVALDFAGDDRVVADYLREEFMSSVAPKELPFLMRTSVLDEPSGDLCDRLLQTEGSAATLRALASANALIQPVGAKQGTFRYHVLLREMLADELRSLHPSEAADLHARASIRYAELDDFDRAVPHAIAAGDIEVTAEMIWSQTPAYSSAGRDATLERWLRGFTEAQTAASAPLSLARATCALTDGDGAAVEHWTDVALMLLDADDSADADAMRVAASVIRAAGCARRGIAPMLGDARAALDLLPEGDRWKSLCRFIEGAAMHLGDDLSAARKALEDGARRGQVQAPSIHALCLSQLALMSYDEGDLEEADGLSTLALSSTHTNGLADEPTAALAFAVRALVAARLGRTIEASEHYRRAAERITGLNDVSPWFEVEVRLTSARALVQLDDIRTARAQLTKAARKLRHVPDAPVLERWTEQAWRKIDSDRVADHWPLTPAELRLLHLLPTHLSYRELAGDLSVSPNTVKTQARSIYSKLGVSSRAEAVTCARIAGLVDV